VPGPTRLACASLSARTKGPEGSRAAGSPKASIRSIADLAETSRQAGQRRATRGGRGEGGEGGQGGSVDHEERAYPADPTRASASTCAASGGALTGHQGVAHVEDAVGVVQPGRQ
jgi:hypothetical protein